MSARGIALAALLPLAGCGGASAPSGSVFRADGISAAIPHGWHAIARPLTGVSSPVQELAVASYAFRETRRPGGCGPTMAVSRMPPGGALLFMWEYRGPTHRDVRATPPRPARFRLDPRTLATYECMGRSYMVRFADHGRVFQAHLYLGARATAATRRRLLGILDSLRVRPQSARAAAIWLPPRALLSDGPHLGVAGIGLRLRRPAVAVSARLAGGRWFALAGRARSFTGHLRPAGRYGRPPVRRAVELLVERSPREYERTSLVVDVAPGRG